MRLFVVRHYKTVCNADKQIMGWGDSPPAEGWEADLVAVCRVLRKTGVSFDAVLTSELRRARATGEFYARELGIDEIHSTAAFNEVNYGSLFRQSKQWVVDNVPEYKVDPDYVFPEGESFTQMQARSVECVRKLAQQRAGQDLLLVVHAGVIRGLICHFLGLPYPPNLKRRVTHRYIGRFDLQGDVCFRYDELGTRSSLVKEGVVSVPWEREIGDAEQAETTREANVTG